MIEFPVQSSLLAIGWPEPLNSFSLQYFSAMTALGLFALIAFPILWLGVRSLSGLGRVRKWVAIGIRLAVLALIVLILGGIRWERKSKDLEVLILRDISESTSNVHNFPGQTLQSSIDNYIASIANYNKPPDDRIGSISFQDNAVIDAYPSNTLMMDAHPIRERGNGTDVANGLRLALATMHSDAMHRLVLVWDGNSTQGDPQEAVSVAIAQHIPIDVMPLHYDVQHEVVMEKMVAPTWKRENEPFSVTVYLKSTNTYPVTGKLTVNHQGVAMDLDPNTPGIQPTLAVTLSPAFDAAHPSTTPVIVKVPALKSRGVHQFHAFFEADDAQAAAGVTISTPGAKTTSQPSNAADTLAGNNGADAYTFVQGKGQILYVDNVADGRGNILRKTLEGEGIEITDVNHITPDEFPGALIDLENYDAIILANVPYGPGGLGEDQQKNLADYVHEMGGGLVMIGGPDAFGAGGWQGKKLEQVLPVNMDIPAKRQIPKGALVLAMDSAEVPNGNYWSEQCAIKAMETLSAKDDVGIITWDWGHGGSCNWDLPLGPKGDGSKFTAAMKHWGLGDLPSFETAINVALDGAANSKGLLASDARQKHIIVITDDDPQMPSRATIERCIKAKISVSTITVYPHQPHNIAAGTIELAKLTGGRSFGPIEDNPNQLPQIFVKEATIVRRSLITESNDGIPLQRRDAASEMIKGLGDLPPVRGMVLTSRKPDPQIEIPIVGGKESDPVLAHWQTGLGRVAAYTSDANTQWGSWWVGSADFSKFWAQVVRGVSRPPMSTLFDVTTTQDGGKGHIRVEAVDKQSGFQNFLNISGKVIGPNTSKAPMDARLQQTGPGVYEGDFETSDPGTYVVALGYNSANGKRGTLLSGVAVNDSPEMRDLQSNDAVLRQIAQQTGGRLLTPFNVASANVFDHNGLAPAVSPLPIWDFLMPFLLGTVLIDVATRRIAWDWNALKSYAATSAASVRAFTSTRKIETRSSVDALRRIREGGSKAAADAPIPAIIRPQPTARFEAQTDNQGDITQVVGGATASSIPRAAKRVQPKGLPPAENGMNSLLEAKRRAKQRFEESGNEGRKPE